MFGGSTASDLVLKNKSMLPWMFGRGCRMPTIQVGENNDRNVQRFP